MLLLLANLTCVIVLWSIVAKCSRALMPWWLNFFRPRYEQVTFIDTANLWLRMPYKGVTIDTFCGDNCDGRVRHEWLIAVWCFAGTKQGNKFFLRNYKLSVFPVTVGTAWIVCSAIAIIPHHIICITSLLTFVDRITRRRRYYWDWDIQGQSVIDIDGTAMVTATLSRRRHTGLRLQLRITMTMLNVQWNTDVISVNGCINKIAHWWPNHLVCLCFDTTSWWDCSGRDNIIWHTRSF